VTPAFHQFKLAHAITAPARCPRCGDWMIAPLSSEFVVGGEIRHHWECDGCGQSTSSVIDITQHDDERRECTA